MEIEKLITSNGTTEQTYDISDPTARQNIINLGSDLNSKISILNNDISKINNLISNVNVLTKCPGTTLIDKLKYGVDNSDILIIDSDIDLMNKNVKLLKPIEIIGNKHTFKNTSIELQSSSIKISNLNIDRNGKTMGDGFNCSNGEFQNINILDCSVKNATHGFNFQSYQGVVQNILINNCKVETSTHGFVSKCDNIYIENCVCENIEAFAFAFISDNIPNTRMALCRNNNILNCLAKNSASAFISYARGYYGTSITPIVSNCSINGLVVENCVEGVKLGDLNSGGDITKIEKIKNFNISNINAIFGEKTIYNYQIINCENILFSNLNGYSNIKINENELNTLLSLYDNIPNKPITYDIISSNVTINTDLEKTVYIRGGGVTTNKINLTGNFADTQKIYMFIAGNGGELTFGGFNENVFANTNAVQKKLVYPDVLCLEFMFSGITSKWLLTKYYKTSYA